MITAHAGLQACHNGVPLEFLYRQIHDRTLEIEIWRVRPLFIDDQTERSVAVERGDRLTPIHGHQS